MTRNNELYAYFTIVGEFNPQEISARLGIEPTKSWAKGDLHPLSGSERKFSRWSLYSRLERVRPFEEHIRDVIGQLRSNASGFRSISQEFGGAMEVVGYFHAQYPGLSLEKEDIDALAEFGLSVDFDYYYMYSDRREDTDS
ncbi:MAG TPA: DUF4279 domain-containing protein [Terracidiphilus sp.]|jgi:hypothetical protein